MKYWTLLLVLLSLPALAGGVYRWVDENGNTVYSDQPADNAEQIELPEASVYSPVIVPVEDTAESDAEEATASDEEEIPPAPGYQLQIASPQNDEAIRANDGNLTVNIQIRPALSQARGDKIQLRMDGRPYGQPSAGLSFNLPNLDRGTHTLSAVVMNANGEELAQSPTIKFHLQRNSILLNPRTQGALPGQGQILPARPANNM